MPLHSYWAGMSNPMCGAICWYFRQTLNVSTGECGACQQTQCQLFKWLTNLASNLSAYIP